LPTTNFSQNNTGTFNADKPSARLAIFCCPSIIPLGTSVPGEIKTHSESASLSISQTFKDVISINESKRVAFPNTHIYRLKTAFWNSSCGFQGSSVEVLLASWFLQKGINALFVAVVPQ
jgi:hypothetical protein